MKFSRYKRELSAAIAYALLLALVAVLAPSFFSAANLRDLALNNAPTLIVATGMTLVILVGEIDISVGSQFAVASVAAGCWQKPACRCRAVPVRAIDRRRNGRGQRLTDRLSPSAFDHRHTGDAGRMARLLALDHRRRMGARICRLNFNGSDSGKAPGNG